MNEATTLTWEITSPEDSDLTCTFNPGGEADLITLEDCSSGETEVTYGETGEFTATLVVTDEYGQETTATHDILVVNAPPVITSFSGPQTVLVNEVITLTWVVDYDGSDDLTCTITSSEGGTPVDVGADCATGSTSFTRGTAGPVLITLTVSDQSGNTVAETLTVQVNNVLAPEITLFAVTSPNVIGDTVTVSWKISNPQGDPLTCSFHSGIDGAPVVEVSDCNDRNGLFSGYPTAGEYTATLTVTDEHNNQVTATQIVHVGLPVAPSIESFAVHSPVKLRYRNAVTWEVNNPHGGPLTCTFTSGEGNAPQVLTNCDDGARTYSYEYANVGDYTATLTMQDEHNSPVTQTAAVRVDPPNAPAVTTFQTDATAATPIHTGAEATFEWVISAHADELPQLSCQLVLGDGNSEPVTCADERATHVYAIPGSHTVQLLITDQYSRITPASLTAHIVAAAPVITSFTVPATAETNETVTFEWAVDYVGDPANLECGVDPNDDTTPLLFNADDCLTGQVQYEYSTASTYFPRFIVVDLTKTTPASNRQKIVVTQAEARIQKFEANRSETAPGLISFIYETINTDASHVCTFYAGDTRELALPCNATSGISLT